MDFNQIPQLTKSANWAVNVSWTYLETFLGTLDQEGHPLELCPDFQRGHVWTTDQQTAYVEYILRGGKSGRDIQFNCIGWNGPRAGAVMCVDGLQRITAVREFMANRIRAFGHLRSEFTGNLRLSGPDFIMHVNDLPTRAAVLQWYLEINSAGTPHTDEELNRVAALLYAAETP